MKLRYTPRSRADMKEIRRYLTEELGNPSAAAHTMESILRSCSRLKEQPFLGAGLTAKIGRDTSLRYLVCGKYLVFYHAEEDTVSVIRVLDGRTDYMRVLFEETK